MPKVRVPKPAPVPVDPAVEALARRLHAAFAMKATEVLVRSGVKYPGWNDLQGNTKLCWYAVAEEVRR